VGGGGRVGGLVGDGGGGGGEVVQRVGGRGGGGVRRVASVQQAEARAGELEGEALPAAALPPFGRGGRRAGAQRSDDPVPLASACPDEAAALHDVDAPAPQRGVHVELAVMVAGGGVARGLRLELGAG